MVVEEYYPQNLRLCVKLRRGQNYLCSRGWFCFGREGFRVIVRFALGFYLGTFRFQQDVGIDPP